MTDERRPPRGARVASRRWSSITAASIAAAASGGLETSSTSGNRRPRSRCAYPRSSAIWDISVRSGSTACNIATRAEKSECGHCRTSTRGSRWGGWRSGFSGFCRPAGAARGSTSEPGTWHDAARPRGSLRLPPRMVRSQYQRRRARSAVGKQCTVPRSSSPRAQMYCNTPSPRHSAGWVSGSDTIQRNRARLQPQPEGWTTNYASKRRNRG